MQLTLVRNATLILDYAGCKILIDPFFAEQGSLPSFTGAADNPTAPLPMAVDDVINGVELVLVSHLHADHFDTSAQNALAKDLPLVCQPAHADKIAEKGFTNLHPLENSIAWKGVSITRSEGHHGVGAVETLMGRVIGFVIRAEGEPTVYWAGDTVLCDDVRAAIQTHQPEVIITHSGGAMWNDPDTDERVLIIMDDAQTVEVAQLAPHATLIAVHLEALDHCTVSRNALRARADAAGLAAAQFMIPADGDRALP